jgi:hypothetical protein
VDAAARGALEHRAAGRGPEATARAATPRALEHPGVPERSRGRR